MKISIDLPDSLLKEVSFGSADPEREIKFLLAVKLVEIGRISTGRASEWLGISRPRFLQEMGRYGLSALPAGERTLKEDVINVRESISCITRK